MNMIDIRDVSRKFGNVTAVDHVSLKIDRSEIFGVIGPDGAGKTTLFRMITSLLLPDEGDLFVNGLDVRKDYRSIRRITGYMPGRFSLYHDLTVEENLQFYATVFGTTVKEHHDLIKDVYSHIEPFKNRQAGKLSGGMKQKLALSCALIHRPVILILDEPTTGVDAVSRKEFWEMLNRIKKEGITILVSTPYMDEATQCDRVAFMQKGKILTVNPPGEIVKSYKRTIVAARSGDMYRLVTDLRSHYDAYSSLLFGHEVHYTSKSGDADLDSLRSFLNDKGHENVELRTVDPIIEDTFLDLMKSNSET